MTLTETDKHRMGGLTAVDRDHSLEDIDFGILAYLNGTLEVREQNVQKLTGRTFHSNDRVRIERQSGRVTYYHNDVLFYTSLIPSHSSLVADVTIHTASGTVTNALVSFGTPHQVQAIEARHAFDQYYRYGYQGQFAEEDEETGWNSFELRMYDPVIGRWLVPDPYNEFWSPYVAFGNDPINHIDPSGGKTEPKPWQVHNFDELMANSYVIPGVVITPNQSFSEGFWSLMQRLDDWIMQDPQENNLPVQIILIGKSGSDIMERSRSNPNAKTFFVDWDELQLIMSAGKHGSAPKFGKPFGKKLSEQPIPGKTIKVTFNKIAIKSLNSKKHELVHSGFDNVIKVKSEATVDDTSRVIWRDKTFDIYVESLKSTGEIIKKDTLYDNK